MIGRYPTLDKCSEFASVKYSGAIHGVVVMMSDVGKVSWREVIIPHVEMLHLLGVEMFVKIVPTYVPISVLSLNTASKYQDRLLLAVGKGSGSLEIWICDATCCDFQDALAHMKYTQIVNFQMHLIHVLTGNFPGNTILAMAYPQERVGVFVRYGKGGPLPVVEYSELDATMSTAINQETGRLRMLAHVHAGFPESSGKWPGEG
ncbi:hypothetical protein Scep_027751 [Stephania cephalantha]|uniref:Uncharacterized protein n=1 Tax=Stephania cephalantha TaxID=152367 RepID=A0AAP0E8M2_9MAGN